MSCKAIITISSTDRTLKPVRLQQCYDGHLAGCARELWEILIPSGIVFTSPQAAGDTLHETSIDTKHPWGANRVFVSAEFSEDKFTYDYHYRILLRKNHSPTITYTQRHRNYAIRRVTAVIINRDIERSNALIPQYSGMFNEDVEATPLLPVGLPEDVL
jgi:hypothetical protein